MPLKRLSAEIQIATPADLTKLVNAFRLSRIILTAFGARGIHGAEREALALFAAAKILRADPRGLERLMNALCVLGLLEEARERTLEFAVLSAIIHMNSAAENKRLFRKCAGALNPGGRLVVQDYIMNDRRTLPATGAFFALNMLVGTRAGDTYTEREVRGWLGAAGFSRIRRIDTPFDSAIIIAQKRPGAACQFLLPPGIAFESR